MTIRGLEQQGEAQHQAYLEALEKATPEQLERAREIVQEHISEYEHSFAETITQIVAGESV